MSNAYLKVKIVSLAQEAQYIHKQERKFKERAKRNRNNATNTAREILIGLTNHRKFQVRREARHALLAYAMLREVPYRVAETKARHKPIAAIIAQNVKRFSPGIQGDIAKMVAAWLEVPLT